MGNPAGLAQRQGGMAICQGLGGKAITDSIKNTINVSIKLENQMNKLLVMILLAGSMSAYADDEGWYAYAGVGQETGNATQKNLDNALTSAGSSGFSSSMNSPTAWNLNIGSQINQNFAIEGGYFRMNNISYHPSGGTPPVGTKGSADFHGWTLAAVGILPVANKIQLLGKLGFAGIQESASLLGPSGTFDISGSKTDLTYGVGAKFDIVGAKFDMKEGFSMRFNLDSYNMGYASYSGRCYVWTVGFSYMF